MDVAEEEIWAGCERGRNGRQMWKCPDGVVEDGEFNAAFAKALGLGARTLRRPDNLPAADNLNLTGRLKCRRQAILVFLIQFHEGFVDVFAPIRESEYSDPGLANPHVQPPPVGR